MGRNLLAYHSAVLCACLVTSITPTPLAAQVLSLPDFRSIDGYGNNFADPSWGAAGTALKRMMPCFYEDSLSTPPASGLPGARDISNGICAEATPLTNRVGASAMVWQWGQFLDHDIDLTPSQSPAEPYFIPVPAGDPYFDPSWSGTEWIPFTRSMYMDTVGVREQRNEITTFIDASNVYGSDPARARELRALDGTGRMRTSAGDLLPYNVNKFDNAPRADDKTMFLAGDVRANEQLGLLALHTLFLREHNYWAGRIAAAEYGLTGDDIYLRARAIVGAEIQSITYREFLPVLLGKEALGSYAGYQDATSPEIWNEFSTAAYRIGHSMLPAELERLDEFMEPIQEGPIQLRDAFFAPSKIAVGGGIEPLLRGLAAQSAREIDPFITDEVRNFLFGNPGEGGFDLAALNIQRGRDHGLPRYNEARRLLGMQPRRGFAGVTPDLSMEFQLGALYSTVDDIDLWIGGLAEEHLPGSMVGELFAHILVDQFERLRAGDRFWYQSYFPSDWVQMIEEQTLATIIRRNTRIGSEIPDDVFRSGETLIAGPSLPELQLRTPFPNPTSSGATVQLVFSSGEPREVSVKVRNARGQTVADIFHGLLGAGEYGFSWDGRDSRGVGVPVGIYFVDAVTEERRSSHKLVVLR